MKRYLVLVALLGFVAGCQTPAPSLSFLAPNSATRVPPPATGSYARPNSYYQPSTVPGASTESLGTDAVGLASHEADAGRGADQDSVADRSGASTESRATSGVRLASASRSVANDSPIRIVESDADQTESSLRLKGMPVNDATTAAEPKRFVPADRTVDISQLPRVTAPQNSGAGARNVVGPTPAASSTSSADRRRSSSPASTGSTGWQTRVDNQNAVRVAGR